MAGVLVTCGRQVSWSDFVFTNFSSLSLSLFSVDGDFFLADPRKVLPGDNFDLGSEVGSFDRRVANVSPFLVSRNSVAVSPLLSHPWKASKKSLMALCPIILSTRVVSVLAPVLLGMLPHGTKHVVRAGVTLVLGQGSR